VKVVMLRIALEGVERRAIRPFDQHHDLARRCVAGIRSGVGIEPTERDDLAAVLADRCDAAPRVRQVVVVICEIEEVESIERHGSSLSSIAARSTMMAGRNARTLRSCESRWWRSPF